MPVGVYQAKIEDSVKKDSMPHKRLIKAIAALEDTEAELHTHNSPNGKTAAHLRRLTVGAFVTFSSDNDVQAVLDWRHLRTEKKARAAMAMNETLCGESTEAKFDVGQDDRSTGHPHQCNGWLEARLFAPYQLLQEREAGLTKQIADLQVTSAQDLGPQK